MIICIESHYDIILMIPNWSNSKWATIYIIKFLIFSCQVHTSFRQYIRNSWYFWNRFCTVSLASVWLAWVVVTRRYHQRMRKSIRISIFFHFISIDFEVNILHPFLDRILSPATIVTEFFDGVRFSVFARTAFNVFLSITWSFWSSPFSYEMIQYYIFPVPVRGFPNISVFACTRNDLIVTSNAVLSHSLSCIKFLKIFHNLDYRL